MYSPPRLPLRSNMTALGMYRSLPCTESQFCATLLLQTRMKPAQRALLRPSTGDT